jgi:hypothetical protein
VWADDQRDVFNKKNEPTGSDKNNGTKNNALSVNDELSRTLKESVVNNIKAFLESLKKTKTTYYISNNIQPNSSKHEAY